MRYAREMDRALNAVRISSLLCRTIQSDMIGNPAIYKGDRSPVTVADYSVQALVCSMINGAFPSDPIVAEEDSSFLSSPENGSHLGHVRRYLDKIIQGISTEEVCRAVDLGNGDVADRYWTLDPIDGTKGFIRGDQYAVALALVENGEVKAGLLGCPNLPFDTAGKSDGRGVIFAAVKGEGAEMRPLSGGSARPVKVSEVSDPFDARMVEGVEAGHSDHGRQSRIARMLGIRKESARMDSQAKYGAVARGEAEIYLRMPSPKSPGYREKIWDHAAGLLLVEEAGGKVTDISGKRLDLTGGRTFENNRGAVVSNGRFHDDILSIIEKCCNI